MKSNFLKRVFTGVMAAALTVSMLPVSAFALTTVTPVSSSSSPEDLTVEYFSSTLYNWDQDAANAATQALNYSYSSTTVRANAFSDSGTYVETDYYYLVDDTYYPVYYSKTWGSNTRTFYYYNGSSYTQFEQLTSNNGTIALYTLSANTNDFGLYFTAAENDGDNVWSNWSSIINQNHYIYSGLAASSLSSSTNAPFSNLIADYTAPLFATDGSNTDYTSVYTDVNVPFVYNSDTGYYTLDSDQWAVYFEDTPSSGSTMAIADKPAAYTWNYSGSEVTVTGFAPFNTLDTSGTVTAYTGGQSLSNDSLETTEAYKISESSVVYGFGMTTSVNFKMTENGIDSYGNDIIFEFSGDDDVWVYVDGVLVLDIGGTHDAITGTINFRTGDVTLSSSYGTVGDLATNSSTATTTNIYGVLSTTLEEFSADGQHTLTIYYMDRGEGRTNCKISFNLPQDDSVRVTKHVETTKISSTGEEITLTDEELSTLNNTEFTFTLYRNGSAVTEASYTLLNSNGTSEGNKTTGADGKFTLKPGQTAVFDVSLDTSRSYYVVEDNPATGTTYYSDPAWTYSTNITDFSSASSTTGVWTSDTYTIEGDSQSTDTLSFVCTNQLSYIPTVKAALVDDVVVIDYNLPVTVDVLANDEIIGNKEISIYSQGNNGSSEFTTDNEIKYTLKNVLSEVDTVVYKVEATDAEDNTATVTDTATLSVVPASSVYYEDDFVTSETDSVVGITYSGNWTNATSVESTAASEQSSENVVYGTDAAYADDLAYTNASARYGTSGATASFTFKGTGVDIYSTTSSDAAYIYVFLYTVSGDTTTLTQFAAVDNYSDQGTYYAVPTVTFEGLDYGEYKVVIQVLQKSETALNYYLDGIRVYNPLGTVTNDGTVAGNAYAAADELNAVYTEIRSLLLDGSAVTDTDGTASGILFIDETEDETVTISTYANDGPKHETYLASGQGIAFRLTNFDEGDAVYIGIKSAQGTAGTVTVTNGTETTTLEITSSADQYYRIQPDADGNVVIKNTGDAVISLTKVRTTSPVTNDIDFETLSTDEITSLLTSEGSTYYFADTETGSEDLEADTEEDVDVDDSSDDGTVTEEQNTFSLVLNYFLGWIRSRVGGR